MRLTSPSIQRLLNQQERALVDASGAANLKGLTAARLRSKVARARALKDKYAGLARERARSARGKAKTRKTTSTRTDDQTMATKAQVFTEVLARFEKRLASVEKAAAPRAGAGRSTPRASKPAERRKERRSTRQATRGAAKVERKARAADGMPERVGAQLGTVAGAATTAAASVAATARRTVASARKAADSARKALSRQTVAERRKKAERMSKDDLKARAQKLVAAVQQRVAEQSGAPAAAIEPSADMPPVAAQGGATASAQAAAESMQARSADAKGARVQQTLATSHVTRMQGHVLARGQRKQGRRDSR